MESWLISSSKKGSGRAKVLPRKFYERQTELVARELLGKILVVADSRGITAGRIVETEAYHGDDPASHCSRGETERCAIMFGEPGVAYVYFIYGMYEMLNFVTEKKGYPGAVLIRALEPLAGEDRMMKRRNTDKRKMLTNGPGRLCQAMGIKLSDNGESLEGPRMTVLDDGFRPAEIVAATRIGITRATDKAWRWYIAGNPFVSRR